MQNLPLLAVRDVGCSAQGEFLLAARFCTCLMAASTLLQTGREPVRGFLTGKKPGCMAETIYMGDLGAGVEQHSKLQPVQTSEVCQPSTAENFQPFPFLHAHRGGKHTKGRGSLLPVL